MQYCPACGARQALAPAGDVDDPRAGKKTKLKQWLCKECSTSIGCEIEGDATIYWHVTKRGKVKDAVLPACLWCGESISLIQRGSTRSALGQSFIIKYECSSCRSTTEYEFGEKAFWARGHADSATLTPGKDCARVARPTMPAPAASSDPLPATTPEVVNRGTLYGSGTHPTQPTQAAPADASPPPTTAEPREREEAPPAICAGQWWRDKDKRRSDRVIEVVEVESGGLVKVRSDKGVESRLSNYRLRERFSLEQPESARKE